MKKFYDTNAILKEDLGSITERIYLSSVTLQELENIKTSRNKDEEVKFNARRITKWLRDNEDLCSIVFVSNDIKEIIEKFNIEINNDSLIIGCAYFLEKHYGDVLFITDDICCYNIAKFVFELNCSELKDYNSIKRSGYKEIIMTDDEMAKFYESDKKDNKYELEINEYLIIKDTLNQPVDAWRYTEGGLVQLDVPNTKSQFLGKLKAKDFYQQCALDSFYSNRITLIKGKAGSGKSYLAMSFLLSQLEKGKIDKIIIFTNPVSTRGSQEIGFLPGTRIEKLLESNVGNFLLGKFGERNVAESMIQLGTLDILPISDIRGFDTTGQRCAIYITEAQNMSVDMMKLSLQRIGDDCICIIDGDVDTQVDNRLFEGCNNGMRRLSEVFSGTDIFGEIELRNIYRSKIAEIADKM